MKEALFYKKLSGKKVKCVLCPHFCTISEGKRGFCGVRKNQGGKLYSLVYGKVASVAVDSIMKKPLFHFAPGTDCLSFSTVGCNLNCLFCQNAELSHPKTIFGRNLAPAELIKLAKNHDVPGIAYTYTEPTIFYEYALDTMKLAKKEGMYNVWVSNGYTNPEPIKKMAKYLDAINIDLKGDVKFYQKLCAIPNEKPVQKALLEYKKQKVWIEITNLIIPGWNDRPAQITKLVSWVKRNLGPDTPMHFTRFWPAHKMINVPPTPVKTIETAYRIAKKAGMHWIYIGNVAGHKFESTYCWKCGRLLIRRIGYELGRYVEKCGKCGQKLVLAGQKWSGIRKVWKKQRGKRI